MIHCHGTPCGGDRQGVVRFLRNRFALVPWLRPEDIAAAAEACRGFVLDNSAFTAWKSGKPILDWSGYYAWVETWRQHPGFIWAIIPDVIDGSEADNDALLDEWPRDCDGVPVYHLHESLERLDRLVSAFPCVAIGSSGQWPKPGRPKWWRRMAEVMRVACDENGRPRCKLHGLRMLDPAIFHRLPLASADSTNATRNATRNHPGLPRWQSAALTADRIESHNSAPTWREKTPYLVEVPAEQLDMFADLETV